MGVPANELPTLTGPVLRVGDDGYDAEVAGFQADYAHCPDLVIGAADAEDIRLAVEYAAAQGVPLAVQSTGHGLSVPADHGVLISTRRMTGIAIDVQRRVARIEAGVRAGALITAAAPFGLAPLNGSSPSVGMVGYTLGGGLGLLARQFGYAADHVRAIDMVTADGRLRRLAPGDELFSAVLGGGGNFGMVTALELELVPVATVYGGQLVFDAPQVKTAVQRWLEWTVGVPDELTSSVAVLRFPDLPMVPEPMRGRYVASIRLAYTGSPVDGERLVAPLRALGPRISDTLRSMPYAESHTIHSDPDHPHPYTATNALLRELTPAAMTTLLAATGPQASVGCVVDIRHLGGALGMAGPAEVALDFREAEYLVRVISMPGPDNAEAIRAHHGSVRAGLAPWTLGHSLAFLYGAGADADQQQTRAGYRPATYARLAAAKADYDPANLFRFNRNITPVSR